MQMFVLETLNNFEINPWFRCCYRHFGSVLCMEFQQQQHVSLRLDGLVHPFGLLCPTSLKREMQHQDGSSNSPVKSHSLLSSAVHLPIVRNFAAPFYNEFPPTINCRSSEAVLHALNTMSQKQQLREGK